MSEDEKCPKCGLRNFNETRREAEYCRCDDKFADDTAELREWFSNEVINPTDIHFSCMSAREKLQEFVAAYDRVVRELAEARTMSNAKGDALDIIKAALKKLQAADGWNVEQIKKLSVELTAARAELERQNEKLDECGALYLGAKDTFKELVREREICGVLREALNNIFLNPNTGIYHDGSSEDMAQKALAREQEMRK